MSIGKKILQIRIDSHKTQRDVSRLTGLAVSYISRLENERITPSFQTLGKLANAFRVPLTVFFDPEPALELADRCPVSLSGRCILDQLFVGRGRRPKIAVESYNPEQLEILRLCNYLLHEGDEDMVTTLATLMRSLADSRARKRRSRTRRARAAAKSSN